MGTEGRQRLPFRRSGPLFLCKDVIRVPHPSGGSRVWKSPRAAEEVQEREAAAQTEVHMKFKALLLALVATLVVASGAAAKNGGGNGKGHAQATHSQSASQGSKHEAKGHTTKAPKSKVKKPKKHEAAAAEEAGVEPALVDAAGVDEPSTEATNPAWTCKALMDALEFVTDYGTNTNGANAFGKCVSSVAHGEEEVTEVPAEPGAACEAVVPAAVESTEVKAEDEESSDVADEESSDVPEVPVCEAADGTETTAPTAADDTSSTGDTTGAVDGTVADPAVPSADDALLAAARAVKAFAATL
jgi:hypothetical protein